ncbi:MAG: Rhomboid family protein [Bryobacterales bacterium]|nr:Rhomboid family protein [Bryobacterales bacterium]
MFPLRDDQPTYSKPVVCVLLIVLNAMVFLHEMQLDEYSRNYFIMRYGLVPDHLRLSSLITMQFIHGGWLHIIGNMIFLWAFGRSLEDAMGSLKFLIFYLLSGIAAALAQVLFSPGSNVPMVGASGAIAGVMGGYLIKFPRARIHTLVFIFIFITRMEIPALFFLPYWFLTQLFAGYGSVAYSHLTEGGVAYFAHIGGFVAGMALVSVLGTQDRYVRRRDIRW